MDKKERKKHGKKEKKSRRDEYGIKVRDKNSESRPNIVDHNYRDRGISINSSEFHYSKG